MGVRLCDLSAVLEVVKQFTLFLLVHWSYGIGPKTGKDVCVSVHDESSTRETIVNENAYDHSH